MRSVFHICEIVHSHVRLVIFHSKLSLHTVVFIFYFKLFIDYVNEITHREVYYEHFIC